MKHTKREQLFLERLGITPGPWEYIDNYVKGIFNPGGECPAHVKNKIHGEFIAKSPDMVLSLWDICLECKELDCFYNENNIFRIACIACELATGKTFDQLLEIWEACKE